MKLHDFLEATDPQGFEPKPFYSPEGDALTFFVADRDHYAERVDELLTVFLDMETDELVGWKIKGIRRLITVLGTFDLVIEHGEDVPLGLFFLAGLTLTQEKFRAFYERCGQASKGATLTSRELPGELLGAAR